MISMLTSVEKEEVTTPGGWLIINLDAEEEEKETGAVG